MHKLISEVVFLCPEGSGCQEAGRSFYEVVSCCKKKEKMRSSKTSAGSTADPHSRRRSRLCRIYKADAGTNMEELAKIRAEVLVSRTVTRVLAEQYQKDTYKDELFTVTKDDEGNMSMVQADSAKINLLMSQISAQLQESFQNMKKEEFSVPAGALLGSRFLSQTGPQVGITVIPLSVSAMDFKTEFETQGINQTKYKIYIVLTCRIKMAAPFSTRVFKTNSTILIAEAVILGKVPDSYVVVPQDDILDALD